MTDLTTQWKKGQLPAGAYYVLLITGEIFPDSYNPYGYFEQFESIVKKVIAPTPSYDEWQTLRRYANECDKKYVKVVFEFENLKKEDAKLREFKDNAIEIKRLEDLNKNYEYLVKQRDIYNKKLQEENKKLKEQLKTATKAIKSIQNEDIDAGLSIFCQNILNQMGEKE